MIERLCSNCDDHCCKECAEENAWFTADIEKLKQEFGFDAKYGFLDKDKSCKLPGNTEASVVRGLYAKGQGSS